MAQKANLHLEQTDCLDAGLNRDELRALLDISKTITSTLDPQEILTLLAVKTSVLLQAGGVLVMRCEPDDALAAVACYGFPQSMIGLRIPYRDREAHNELAALGRAHKWAYFAGSPIFINNDICGLLCIFDADARFGQQEQDEYLLNLVADFASAALKNSCLYQEVLRKQQNLADSLSVVFRQMPEGLLFLDEQRRLTLMNPAALRLLGIETPRLLESFETFCQNYSVTFPEMPKEFPLLLGITEQGLTGVRGRAGLTGRDLDFSILGVSDGITQASSIIIHMCDITEERRQKEANERKNGFLAMLSHELRNPLAAIGHSLAVLDRSVPGGEQFRRAKGVIGRQFGQLSRLVDDLLDITRITQNKIKLQLECLELNGLVRRTIDDYQSLFHERGVHLEADFSPCSVFCNVDNARLMQVVGNLLMNAAKFCHYGGNTHVSVAAESSARQAVIRIADTGIGIAPEALPRLFQPFMQVDTSSDRRNGGLGLGLALSRDLIELHGGEVSVHSAGVGKGSEFIVRLPLVEALSDKSHSAREALGQQARRILIIEDNIDLAQSLRDLLELYSHHVAVAYDSAAGLAMAPEFQPDVLLCDIGLPDMDGYEVARSFRCDEALKDVFLVALTGYALPEDLERATKAGFDRHLAKPLDLTALEQILADLPRVVLPGT